MPIKTTILDGKGTGKELELEEKDGKVGAIAYTEPLKKFLFQNRLFFNPQFGTNMAVNGAFGGTPVEIHDGLDNVYWTGTSIVGTSVTFDSTDRANTGTQSVYFNRASVGDITQFASGSTIDLTNYSALTMFINVDSAWAADSADSIEIYGYNTGTASQVGVAVKLENYFSEQIFDTWHKLSIPLTDMNLEASTVDAFRIQTVAKSRRAPRWYLDDFQIEETGGGIEFRIDSEKGFINHVGKVFLSFVDDISGSVVNGTMPGLSYNKLMGLNELENGAVFTIQQGGKITGQFNYKNLYDFIFGGAEIISAISDGTNTAITIGIEWNVDLDYRHRDFMSIVINDDLSGLIIFNVVAAGQFETITGETDLP